MSLAKYLFFMTLTTSTCWLFWLFVLLKMNPQQGSWLAPAAFFTTLGLAFLGTFSTLGFLVRIWAHKQASMHDRVVISFRQGLLLTTVLTVSLALLHVQRFTITHVGILMVLAVLTELISIKMKRS